MKLKSPTSFIASLITTACLLAAGVAHAGAVIENAGGTLRLGVNDEGHLNFVDPSRPTVNGGGGATGLAFKMTPPGGSAGFYDSTSPGCLCEGWGVSVNGTTSGYANVSTDGVINLTTTSFLSTASTATSAVELSSLPGLTVKHEYSEAGASFFKSVVTIRNETGATVTDLKYVRVMDWDIPFTEFDEFVTIKGTATTTLLEKSHDNGFNTANPLSDLGPRDGATEDVDFEDNGASDHGAYFRFNFGSLADKTEYTFEIYYGAADSERAALAAIGAQGLELYSLGQSNGGEISGIPATFIFGFKGVGGVALTPTPGSLALVGLGLLGAGMVRRRRA